MGGGASKQQKLTQYELTEFTNQTNLTYQQVENLHAFYKKISSSVKDDGVIDMQEFSSSLLLDNSEFAQHIFDVFDLNSDKVINFREFILGVSNLVSERLEFKIRFAFNLIDSQRTKKITEEQFFSYFSSLTTQFPGFNIPKNILRQMISTQMDSISEFNPHSEDDNEGKQNADKEILETKSPELLKEQSPTKSYDTKSFTYNQFKQFMIQNPTLLKLLSLDPLNISAGAQKLLGKKK